MIDEWVETFGPVMYQAILHDVTVCYDMTFSSLTYDNVSRPIVTLYTLSRTSTDFEREYVRVCVCVCTHICACVYIYIHTCRC